MKQDHSADASDDERLPYSCRNRRFQTDTSKGMPHAPVADTLGSVLDGPLISSDGYSLWLEHVIEIESRDEYYWLMWYDAQGAPTIPMSGVFQRRDLSEMLRKLAEFTP